MANLFLRRRLCRDTFDLRMPKTVQWEPADAHRGSPAAGQHERIGRSAVSVGGEREPLTLVDMGHRNEMIGTV
jgi:hypothetical protein